MCLLPAIRKDWGTKKRQSNDLKPILLSPSVLPKPLIDRVEAFVVVSPFFRSVWAFVPRLYFTSFFQANKARSTSSRMWCWSYCTSSCTVRVPQKTPVLENSKAPQSDMHDSTSLMSLHSPNVKRADEISLRGNKCPPRHNDSKRVNTAYNFYYS